MLQAGLVLSQVGLVSVSKQLLVTMSLKQKRGWKRRYNHQLLPLGPGDVRKANQKDVQKRRAGCSDSSSYGQVLQRCVLILEAWCIRDCDCKRWSGANAISIWGLKVGSVDECCWVCRSIQRKPGGQNLQNVKEWHCWDDCDCDSDCESCRADWLLALAALVCHGLHMHLQEAVKNFENMSQEVPDDLGICTLATGCVNAGDLLMVPSAFILTQKAVNTNTIGIRTSSHLLCHDAVGGPRCLRFSALCFVLCIVL